METDTGEVYDSDAYVRRTMELDDEDGFYTGVTTPSGGCGTSGGDDDGGGGKKPKKPK